MPEYDSRTKLEALRDHFEIFSKASNYLLVGNGTGFVGCLTVAKDNLDKLPDHLRMVGVLIVIFGAGLLLAVLDWAVTMAIKIDVTQRIISIQPYSQAWLPWLGRKLQQLLAHIGLWGSLICFGGGVILIMSHFVHTIPPEVLKLLGLT